jgi:hypothetical protein
MVRLLFAAVAGVLSACTTLAPSLDDAGVVAIVPAVSPPASNFSTFAKSKPEGAATGAVTGAGVTAGSVLITAPILMGPYAPLGVVLGLVAAAAAGAVGAVAGAVAAVPHATAQEIESTIDAAVAQLDAQRLLADRLVAQSGLSREASSADTLLHVRVTEIGFETCTPELVGGLQSCHYDPRKPVLGLYLRAETRLVGATDGSELHARRFRFASARRLLERWVADGGRLLAEEMDAGLQELAERINDEVLLASRLDLPGGPRLWGLPGVTPHYGNCWLNPLEPTPAPLLPGELLAEVGGRLRERASDVCPAAGLHFAPASSLAPLLRWEPFPRPVDRESLEPAQLAAIGNVTYDLRIWEVEGCERGGLAYQRAGLADTQHRLEGRLAPAARYYWTIRARFTYEGAAMVTRWAAFDPMNCHTSDFADRQYHRFVTPAGD